VTLLAAHDGRVPLSLGGIFCVYGCLPGGVGAAGKILAAHAAICREQATVADLAQRYQVTNLRLEEAASGAAQLTLFFAIFGGVRARP
jgi:hypothetical protein